MDYETWKAITVLFQLRNQLTHGKYLELNFKPLERYQTLRMKEAARLLKAKKLTVSEVGYEMFFFNLSHFTRTFEKHTGMKPKKYAQSG